MILLLFKCNSLILAGRLDWLKSVIALNERSRCVTLPRGSFLRLENLQKLLFETTCTFVSAFFIYVVTIQFIKSDITTRKDVKFNGNALMQVIFSLYSRGFPSFFIFFSLMTLDGKWIFFIWLLDKSTLDNLYLRKYLNDKSPVILLYFRSSIFKSLF